MEEDMRYVILLIVLDMIKRVENERRNKDTI